VTGGPSLGNPRNLLCALTVPSASSVSVVFVVTCAYMLRPLKVATMSAMPFRFGRPDALISNTIDSVEVNETGSRPGSGYEKYTKKLPDAGGRFVMVQTHIINNAQVSLDFTCGLPITTELVDADGPRPVCRSGEPWCRAKTDQVPTDSDIRSVREAPGCDA
jgi:hypothetical protein